MHRFYVVYSQDQIGQKKRNTGKTIPSVREIQKKIDETLCETIRLGIYKYNSTLSDVLYKINKIDFYTTFNYNMVYESK